MVAAWAKLALYLTLFYAVLWFDSKQIKQSPCFKNNYNALLLLTQHFMYQSCENGRLEVRNKILVHRVCGKFLFHGVNTGRRYSKKRTVYYRNSVASFNLLIKADVEKNSSPNDSTTSGERKSKQCNSSEGRLRAPKCMQCDKAVKVNNKRLCCNYCLELTHIQCMLLKNRLIQHENYWTCPNCLGRELPFYNVRDLNEIDNDILGLELLLC
jgi:hypothetical protein